MTTNMAKPPNIVDTESRKQMDFLKREELFLDVARSILVQQGFSELNLEKVAAATGWSKGTVHLHFKTKEDLVTAVAAQTTARRLELFERASKFVGRPRERVCAIGLADELFARLYPHYFGSELIIKMAMLQERATPERRESLKEPEQRCFQAVLDLVYAAVANGDLVLTPPMNAVDVTFVCVSMAIGAHTTTLNFPNLFEGKGLGNPLVALREGYHRLLDGYGWKPLSSEWDYSETDRRLARDIFPDECARIVLG